mgnify:CR=1 FL=1
MKRKKEENVPIFSEEKSKNCSSSEIQQENPSKRQKELNFPAKFAVEEVTFSSTHQGSEFIMQFVGFCKRVETFHLADQRRA